MDLNEYQRLSTRTLSAEQPEDQRLAWNALGLAGEAGEVADEIKKVVFHKRPLNRDKVVKEMGDVLWYLAALSTVLGVPLSEVAQANVDKLLARYPDGFSPEASAARVDERKAVP